MHKVTRRAMFETNSSSTHSITIVDGKLDDKLPVRDGICKVHAGSFGWEEMDYDDAATKASYCLTWAKDSSAPSNQLTMLEEVIKEVTGAKEVVFVPYSTGEDAWDEWGSIDHQSGPSEGGAGEGIFESKETLKNFIFCSQSKLYTGNDNG